MSASAGDDPRMHRFTGAGAGINDVPMPSPSSAPPTTRRVRFAGLTTPSPSSSRVRMTDDADPSVGPRHQALTLPPPAVAALAPATSATDAMATAAPASSSSSSSSSSSDLTPATDLSSMTSEEIRRTQLLLAQFAAPEVCADPDDEQEEMSVSRRSYSHSAGGQISQAGTDDGNDLTATPQPQHRAFANEHHLAPPHLQAQAAYHAHPPTYAMAPGKQVCYVDSPAADGADPHGQHDSALGIGDGPHGHNGGGYGMPRYERDESSSSFQPYGGGVAFPNPYAHYQRTPSPQPHPHPPTIVSFSSRVKGSSVLFAPWGASRSRSSSGGSGAPFDSDEAARRARGRSPLSSNGHRSIPLATPAHMLALQMGNSGSAPGSRQGLFPPEHHRYSRNNSRSGSFQSEMMPLGRDRSGSAHADGAAAAAASNRVGPTGAAIATSVPNGSCLAGVLGSGPEPLLRGSANGSGNGVGSGSGSGCSSSSANGRSLGALRNDQGVGHVMMPRCSLGNGMSRLGQEAGGGDGGGGGDTARDRVFSLDMEARPALGGGGGMDLSSSPVGSSPSDERSGPGTCLARSGELASYRDPAASAAAAAAAASSIGLVPPRDSTLPLYTRVLRLFLIAVGVVRYCTPERPKLLVLNEDEEEEAHGHGGVHGHGHGDPDDHLRGHVPVVPGITSRYRDRDRDRDQRVSAATAALEDDDEDDVESRRSPRTPEQLEQQRRRVLPASSSHRRGGGALGAQIHAFYIRVRSYIYPLIVFLFILTNVFFVTVSDNVGVDNGDPIRTPTSRSYTNWISLASDFCMNLTPLLSWVGAFYFVGWSDERAYLVFFEQLANLESYTQRTVRNYLAGAAFAGLVLMATTNLTSVDGSQVASHSFFSLVNVGLFVLLNYLITTFVICALASLICIFHYYSLRIFQEQLYSQDISVVEAIREHIVLMRLVRESSKYLQYIIFPPLLLYITGALLAGYNMLSTEVYSDLAATAFQLIMAFVTLMIPLVSGAQITRVCAELARLATNLDLTSNLVERSSLIQQLVLLPGNAFFVCGIEVNYGLLAKVLYALVVGVIVLARGAAIY